MKEKASPSYKRGSYKKKPFICEWCGRTGSGTARKKYCNNVCKQQAKLERQRQREKEKEKEK